MKNKLKRKFKVRKHQIYVLNKNDIINHVSAKEAVSISRIDNQNVEHVLDFREPHYLDTFRNFLSSNNIGVFAWHDGTVIGHLWAAFSTNEKCRARGY